VVGAVSSEKCIINRQVAPAELEALLLSHAAVQDAAVIGKSDERFGELPTAFVVLKPNHSTTQKELQQFVAGKHILVISNGRKRKRKGRLFIYSAFYIGYYVYLKALKHGSHSFTCKYTMPAFPS